MSSDCLNCPAPVTNNYCANCGQKSFTHRYSIKHFITHDFVHGIWDVDKGIYLPLKRFLYGRAQCARVYPGKKGFIF